MKEQLTRPRQGDHKWAQEAVTLLIAGCVLNAELKKARICDKYLCEMSDAEVERYTVLIENLRRLKRR